MGGNSPQTLVNGTALEIQRGELDLAILTGGEAWRTRMRARKAGRRADVADVAAGRRCRACWARTSTMNHPAERARGIVMPVQVYPMFETAIRAAAGRTRRRAAGAQQRAVVAFSEVAAANPYAWLREAKTAEEIRTPSADATG